MTATAVWGGKFFGVNSTPLVGLFFLGGQLIWGELKWFLPTLGAAKVPSLGFLSNWFSVFFTKRKPDSKKWLGKFGSWWNQLVKMWTEKGRCWFFFSAWPSAFASTKPPNSQEDVTVLLLKISAMLDSHLAGNVEWQIWGGLATSASKEKQEKRRSSEMRCRDAMCFCGKFLTSKRFCC